MLFFSLAAIVFFLYVSVVVLLFLLLVCRLHELSNGFRRQYSGKVLFENLLDTLVEYSYSYTFCQKFYAIMA